MLFIFKVVSKLTLTTQTWRKKMGMCCHHHFNHRECEHCFSLSASDDRIETAEFSIVPTSPWRTSRTVPSPRTCSEQQLPYYSPDLFHPRGWGRMYPESRNAIWEKWTQPSNEKWLGFLVLPLFSSHLWTNCFHSLYLCFTSKELSPGWSAQLYGSEPWVPISARRIHS